MELRFILNLLIILFIPLSNQSCSRQDDMLGMTINEIDLSKIPNGEYIGDFEKYRWFYKIEVVFSANRIDTIRVIKSSNGTDKVNKELVRKVIEKQSLLIDACSGATITSKTFLKAVENALTKD